MRKRFFIIFFALGFVPMFFASAQSLTIEKDINLGGTKSVLNALSIGVGIASPGALLDVQGAAQFGSGNVNLIDSSGKIAGISSTYFASLNGSNLTGLTASMVGLGNVTNESKATMFASPTFTGSVTMPGTGIWNSSGNVGISTTSPAYKLDVVGTGRFTSPVIVGTPTADSHATTRAYVDSAVSSAGEWTTTSTGIYYNSGNVGIGTASPSTALQVAGTVTATAFAGPLTGNVTGDVTGSSGSTTGNAATATALQTARNIFGISFNGTANIGSALGTGAYATIANYAPLASPTFTGTLYLDGAFDARNIYGVTGLHQTNASPPQVGIGTMSPDALLDVDGTAWLRGAESGTGGLYVDSTGKVGIGTGAVALTDDLEVKGSGFANVIINGSSGGLLSLKDDGVTYADFYANAGGVFLYGRGGNNTLRIANSSGYGIEIIDNGKVGIGTITPGYLLQVGESGDGTQARANAWNTFSDARLKKDLEKINSPFDILAPISGYYFHWKEGTDKSRHVGILAQDVELTLPEAVSIDDEGMKSVDYDRLVPVLINAVKELKSQNDNLKEIVCGKYPDEKDCDE